MGAWYHASKHAVEGWSECLRFELEPFGVDVTLIEPGLIATEFNDVVSTTVPPKSMNGAYKESVDAVTRGAENGLSSSPPSVIAHTISKAIKYNRSRTRYVVGSMAQLLIFMRRWFGDRFFDMALNRMGS